MVKRMFWIATLAFPLSLTAACGMVSDDLRNEIEEGTPGDGKPGEGIKPPKPECKLYDKTPAIDCKYPEFLDKDKDGCIDVVVCLDGNGCGSPQCDPPVKITLDACKDPKGIDHDGDGCIDELVCPDVDGGGAPQCKPPVKITLDACKDVKAVDHDGDGCIDTYVCADYEFARIPL